MATMSKVLLSGSTNGKAVQVTTTATDGTGDAGLSTANVIHRPVTGTSDIDEIWIYANNTSTSAVKLTLEWGTTTADEGNIEQTIPAESGLSLIVPGLCLQNGGASLEVRAFAGTADVILITGYVNRITA